MRQLFIECAVTKNKTPNMLTRIPLNIPALSELIICRHSHLLFRHAKHSYGFSCPLTVSSSSTSNPGHRGMIAAVFNVAVRAPPSNRRITAHCRTATRAPDCKPAGECGRCEKVGATETVRAGGDTTRLGEVHLGGRDGTGLSIGQRQQYQPPHRVLQ